MEQQVELTEATPEEAPSLDIVRRQAIEIGFTDAYKRNQFADLVAQPDPNLPDWINEGETIVLVAKSEFTPFSYGVLDRSEGTVKGLYTAENYQGEGHASKILERFETVSREDGIESLSVDSPRNAIGFFEEHGFRRMEELVPEALGFPIVRMEKQL